jgi:acetate kinase
MAVASCVLVLNCGSSSVKFALVEPESGRRLVTALAERVGTDRATVQLRRAVDAATGQDSAEIGDPPDEDVSDGSHRGVVAHLLGALTAAERASVVAVGHRVVHGGSTFSSSVVVDEKVQSSLQELVGLAPLHMPANLAGIQASQAELPDCPQVVVFDTAFHQSMPPVAYRYAVPPSWYADHDVRRYGFHGTSHRYVSSEAAGLLGRPLDSLRMVTVHLGNGCSATAVRDGRSVDTTMGLTPLEGLVMGTRSGDVDPGLLGYIAERLGLDLAGVLKELNSHSGILGLSRLSNDMRTVLGAARDGDPDAQLAVDVFCYRAAKAIAALSVPLGRLDAVVFTGGIGEHSPEVRGGILARLGILGLSADAVANARHGSDSGGVISSPGSVVALVVPTDEERVIARDTWEMTRR